MTPLPVVLVHGAWHGAWCWERVLPLLDQAGVETVAVNLPDGASTEGIMGDLVADTACVARALEALGRPAVLCGHSYGGAVVTVAGAAAAHLVFLAAIVPSDGASIREQMPPPAAPRPPLATPGEDGLLHLGPEGLARLYSDCPPGDVAAASAHMRPMQAGGFMEHIAEAAWRRVRSTYAVCTRDEGIEPQAQRLMAARAGSEVVEWPTGHSPFWSAPHLVADLLIEVCGRIR